MVFASGVAPRWLFLSLPPTSLSLSKRTVPRGRCKDAITQKISLRGIWTGTCAVAGSAARAQAGVLPESRVPGPGSRVPGHCVLIEWAREKNKNSIMQQNVTWDGWRREQWLEPGASLPRLRPLPLAESGWCMKWQNRCSKQQVDVDVGSSLALFLAERWMLTTRITRRMAWLGPALATEQN